MKLLKEFQATERLFTYKVAHDGGSAPNPYHRICTLGLCKPAVRRVARFGDVVVGLACGQEETRLIYCMVVEHALSWPAYIAACGGAGKVPRGLSASDLRKKIPRSAADPGDCIWPDGSSFAEALPSWSDHGGYSDFQRDVLDGQNVLLGTTFWYFGKGDKHALHLPRELHAIIPDRGHRSNANGEFRHPFVTFFNDALRTRGIATCGKHGTPALDGGMADLAERSRCRAEERELDAYGEEANGREPRPRHC